MHVGQDRRDGQPERSQWLSDLAKIGPWLWLKKASEGHVRYQHFDSIHDVMNLLRSGHRAGHRRPENFAFKSSLVLSDIFNDRFSSCGFC
jgi:hypothetical protein